MIALSNNLFDGRGSQWSLSRPTLGLLKLFVANQLRVALAMPLLAVLFVCFVATWGAWSAGLPWLALILICQGLQLVTCRRFERARLGDEDQLATWLTRLVGSEVLYSLAWASALLWFWSPVNAALNLAIITVLLVAITVRLIIASHCLPIVVAGTLPTTIAIILRCVEQGDPFYVGIAILVTLAELYFLHLARSLHQTAHDMLIFRAQKDALIDALARETAEADAARRKAEAANRAKSRFLATMSHELRTPLNAILGFSEMVKTEMLGPVGNIVYKAYAGDIHHSGQHLLSLINEILDLSRIESGRYELNEDAVSVAEIGREVCHLLSMKAAERQITLQEQFEAELPKLIGDERAIRQIWINLVGNAIKFSPQGSKVILRVGLNQSGGLRLAVLDEGPGIAASELPHIFSAFGRGDASVSRQKEGVGLGLSIVRGLAKLHGATVEVRSTQGEGTCLSVDFPLTRILDETPLERRPLAIPTEGQRLLMAITR
ncbi:two-component system cell cycle sensor histidine kinase PleC [Rhodoligotrophos appendicifer]|uniref:sensor histidine kinase n=1 Tax=Rhodoligotrophos appendicifer TaxID=987056 RepID=UPI001186DDF7|nr:ATP-binding protein [Rhodoligotrophos appendicifer]